MSSKNNPENRGQAQVQKKYNGKVIKPVYYVGKHKGHGNYMAAQYESGDVVLHPVTKKPLSYAEI
jgi:hypothetical protein